MEKAVYELVDTLKAGLADNDKKVLTAEEGYACLMPDHKNKKQRCQDCIACSYYTLLNYFTQRNTEALVKGTRGDRMNPELYNSGRLSRIAFRSCSRSTPE